jgi:uncharacterized protein YegP (UPF0339 family)
MEWQMIYNKSHRQWRFRFWSSNGRVIVWSEYYYNRSDADAALLLVQRYAATAPVVEYTED